MIEIGTLIVQHINVIEQNKNIIMRAIQNESIIHYLSATNRFDVPMRRNSLTISHRLIIRYNKYFLGARLD